MFDILINYLSLVSNNCQFIFLLRDSENDPYPKNPYLKKKRKTKKPLKKIPAIFSYPKKSQQDPLIIHIVLNTRVSEVHGSTPRVHASLETGPWKPMKTLREIEANCSKSAAIFARYAERMWP